MKTKAAFLLIFIMAISSTFLFSQNDSVQKRTKKIIWGAQTGVIVTNCSQGGYYAYCTLDIRNSSFCFGPAVGPKKQITQGEGNSLFGGGDPIWYLSESVPGQYSLNGFHLIYQHNHLTKNSDVNERFFQYHFIYLHYAYDGNYYYGNGYAPYKAQRHDTEHLLVFGYKLKITKNIYLTPSVGIGVFFDHTSVDFLSAYKDYERDYSLGDIMASIGIGYKFNLKNK